MDINQRYIYQIYFKHEFYGGLALVSPTLVPEFVALQFLCDNLTHRDLTTAQMPLTITSTTYKNNQS